MAGSARPNATSEPAHTPSRGLEPSAASVPATVSSAPPDARPTASPRATRDELSRSTDPLDALARALAAIEVGAELAHDELKRLTSRGSKLVAGSRDEQVECLARRVDELELELAEQRAEVDRQKTQMLEEQDRFLAGVLEEHEAAIAAVARERDAVLAQVRAQRAGASAATGASVSRPPDPDGWAGESVLELRAELEHARRTIERQNGERERLRELVQRLQRQRDEAQRLAQGARSLPSATPALRERQRRSTQPAPPLDQTLADIESDWDRDGVPAPPPSMSGPLQHPSRRPSPRVGSNVAVGHDLAAEAEEEPSPALIDGREGSTHATALDRPALASRPLVGYSVKSGETGVGSVDDVGAAVPRRSQPAPR